ncbi:MFS transporter [Ornithinimicrobium sp. Y1694]|uniref:MFS transporter n=1 Tax=Ornithinimicrobium sp. Y1694 TaxID=3418590 RepID=UPI003CF5EBC0
MMSPRALGRGVKATRQPAFVLAAALLLVELVAAMQVYLSSTITPLLAAELDGQRLYGVAAAAALVASFVTMPLGGVLLARFRASRLITWLTMGSVLAAVVSATAPSMEVFILGRALAGLASGAIATVGLGVIVSSLPPSWRRLVLAFYNVVWLLASLVGPAYAAWLSHWLDWRWALVAYLPALILARLLIARQLERVPPPAGKEGRLPLRQGLLLATGVALISALTLSAVWGWLAVIAGLIVIAVVARDLVPTSVLRAAPVQPAAVAGLGLLAVVYFGANAVAAIAAHDLLGFNELGLGVLLTAGGVAWSLTGLWCGARPLADVARRAHLGVGLLAFGLSTMAVAVHTSAPGQPAHLAYIGGWAAVGLGMGLVYLDLLNRGVQGDHPDLPPGEAPTIVVLAEAIPTAVAMTLCAGLLGLDPATAPWVFAGLAVLSLTLPWCILRSTRSARAPGEEPR